MLTSPRVKQLAQQQGFTLCGIARALPAEHAEHVIDWIAAGRGGEMHYLRDQLAERLDPQRVLKNARTVIAVADYIGSDVPRSEFRVPSSGRVARYAQLNDYHPILKKRLHRLADDLRELAPERRFRTCVDTAPTLEREHAARAGIGWTGKNTMVIHPRIGSQLVLGVILTDMPLEPDPADPLPEHFRGCGSCTRCIDACPTGCITPWSVDASRCISYLTIEHRGEIPGKLAAQMGDWVFGCDVCQQVCPFNAADHVPPTPIPPEYQPARPATLDLLEVLNWTEESRRTAFVKSAMKRASLGQMKRNALIAAGNLLRRQPDDALRERIRQIADDETETPLVRQTAERVLREGT